MSWNFQPPGLAKRDVHGGLELSEKHVAFSQQQGQAGNLKVLSYSFLGPTECRALCKALYSVNPSDGCHQ